LAFVLTLGALLTAAPQPPSAQEPADHIIAEAKKMAIARTGPSCGPHPQLKAADFSIPLTEIQTFKDGPLALDALKSFGVRTIFRYYDLPTESLDCKTLLSDELDLILASGFSVAIVFQHHGNEPLTFLDPGRAQLDAKRSLELAEAHGQPYLTAIYFGVDGAENEIVAYANEIRNLEGRAAHRGTTAGARRREFPEDEPAGARSLHTQLRVFSHEPRDAVSGAGAD
jgi:hypothetical protein